MERRVGMLDWLKLKDVERRRFGNRTWIPLPTSRVHLLEKTYGFEGYRRDMERSDAVIVFKTHREECSSLGWQDINPRRYDRAWADDERFRPPGAYYGANNMAIGFYPILRQGFDTGEPCEWHLSQELEFSLGLLRRGDVWVRPEEDYRRGKAEAGCGRTARNDGNPGRAPPRLPVCPKSLTTSHGFSPPGCHRANTRFHYLDFRSEARVRWWRMARYQATYSRRRNAGR
jgi:hypothetical protein